MKIPTITKNGVDKFIEYFAPIHGAKRLRARTLMAVSGAWTGAARDRRATKEWLTHTGDADADLIFDLAKLRERSRDLARNAPIATGAISTCLTNVVGTGLKLQSRIDRSILPFTEEEADAWEEKTEREWRLFSESKELDATRKLNFAGIQELAFRQTLENGESFVLLPRFARSGSPYSLKIQLIEADRVCNEKNAPNSEFLIEGIEKDRNGATTQIHILNQHPGTPYYSKNAYTWTKVPAYGSRTGLPNVLQLYRITRPGQTRGIPFLSYVIEPLRQLDEYTKSEIMRAVISSMFTVFIKTEAGDINFDYSGMGVETGAKASDTDLKLAPGAILGLNPREDVAFADPTSPNSAFENFFLIIVKQIAAALEMPFEVILKCFNSSYSASRAALLEAWRAFRGRRIWLATNLCDPVYESFLYEAVAQGRISAPGFFSDELIRKAYCGATWIGDSPGYIDPQKDVEAAVKRIEAGLSTLDEETTLITGGDAEKNLPRIRKERKELAEMGMWQPAQSKAPAPAPSAPAKDQNPEDQPIDGGEN